MASNQAKCPSMESQACQSQLSHDSCQEESKKQQAGNFLQQTGEQMKNMAQGAAEAMKHTAQGAAEAVKNTLGMGDNSENSTSKKS